MGSVHPSPALITLVMISHSQTVYVHWAQSIIYGNHFLKQEWIQMGESHVFVHALLFCYYYYEEKSLLMTSIDSSIWIQSLPPTSLPIEVKWELEISQASESSFTTGLFSNKHIRALWSLLPDDIKGFIIFYNFLFETSRKFSWKWVFIACARNFATRFLCLR